MVDSPVDFPQGFINDTVLVNENAQADICLIERSRFICASPTFLGGDSYEKS